MAESAKKPHWTAPYSDPFRYDSDAAYSLQFGFSPMTRRQDPVVSSSFREALVVISIWLVAMIWTVTVCYRMGYNRPADDLKLIYGFPDWIFWGIVVPWCLCTVVSCLFSALLFRDGQLGADVEDANDLGLGG